ncbi:MAG TPA: DUF1015 domain-containing protein [Nocardioidaceae bacterium]|nr:DUF1015 domain-containing protein [Nocardioidaceae bacterium]
MAIEPGTETAAASPMPGRRPFVLAPFRGLRFDPRTVGDLGTVISPPYDVLDAETVRDLEAVNRRNIVRLILSRRFERPYLAVRKRLHSWREKSYLRADDAPALYLYQYTVDQVTVRGLVGVAALREEHERVILPHEDVMPGPVEDRAVLMRTTESNLEPILLVHEGTERLRTLLTETTRNEPLVTFTAADGSDHVMWALVDPECLALVSAELADTQALIADGHHRYAAYLDLQREMRDATAGTDESPWDFGLALLVDQHDYPLTVGPIHRSVAALTIADVQEISADRGDEFATFRDREAAFTAQAEHAADGRRASFVLSDARVWAVLSTPRSHAVDAAVLHEELFEAWHVAEEQVGYHHSLDQALQTTARQPGIVVAVHPPNVRQVMETAARGVRMPRKSTSFSPKPSMGVVMRDLHDT